MPPSLSFSYVCGHVVHFVLSSSSRSPSEKRTRHMFLHVVFSNKTKVSNSFCCVSPCCSQWRFVSLSHTQFAAGADRKGNKCDQSWNVDLQLNSFMLTNRAPALPHTHTHTPSYTKTHADSGLWNMTNASCPDIISYSGCATNHVIDKGKSHVHRLSLLWALDCRCVLLICRLIPT